MIGLMTIAVAASAIQTAPVTTTKAPILTNEQAAILASLPAINPVSFCERFIICLMTSTHPATCDADELCNLQAISQ
jgi:hypothetical protein